MRQEKTKKLVTSAMLISLGTVISLVSELIPFLNLPYGGTVTLASLLPLVLISNLYGIRWGLGSGLVYSLLQMAVGFRTVSALFLPTSDSYMGSVWIAFSILLLDYVFAYTSVGLGGVFRKQLSFGKSLVIGSVIALTLCYLST
jgi:thiamine transporter